MSPLIGDDLMGKYTGVLCEACQKPFAKDDDVVVCPECGAPHHRECYKSLGKCALSDKHSPGFEWKAKLPDNAASESIVCSHCNSVNPGEAKYCIMCGTPLSENYQGKEGRYTRRHSEHQSDENYSENRGSRIEFSVDGVTSHDLIAYTGDSFHYYMRSFRTIISGFSVSWNWAALLFSYFYFFYRKMYKVGAILLAIRLISFIPALICYAAEPTASMELMGVTVYYNAVLMDKLSPLSSILNMLVTLSHIYSSIFANKYYLKQAVRTIRGYKERKLTTEGSSEYFDDINQLGRPSVLSVLIVISLLVLFYIYAGSFFTISV